MPDPIDIFTRKTVANDVGEPSADPAIIEMLEEILKDAKAGNVMSLILVGANYEGGITTAWSSTIFDQPLLHIGAMEAIKTRILLSSVDDEGEE